MSLKEITDGFLDRPIPTPRFCPEGHHPPEPPTPPEPPVKHKGREIHPNGNRKKCVDVRGDRRENGTPVQM
jgi:hypothetical protein